MTSVLDTECVAFNMLVSLNKIAISNRYYGLNSSPCSATISALLYTLKTLRREGNIVSLLFVLRCYVSKSLPYRKAPG